MTIDIENYHQINKSLSSDVLLVAVSKTKPIEAIEALYNEGQRIFGENRIQELCNKYEKLPKDIQWHMIGHLQTNKVKYIASFVNLIHSVDSFKLLKEINKQAAKNNRVIDCLIQFYIAQEDSKYGFTLDEFNELVENQELDNLKNVKIKGVMGMATFTDNQSQIRKEFQNLKNIFDTLKQKLNISILSMGMSNDYDIAIEEGSNMVRIGSRIFGARNYN